MKTLLSFIFAFVAICALTACDNQVNKETEIGEDSIEIDTIGIDTTEVADTTIIFGEGVE